MTNMQLIPLVVLLFFGIAALNYFTARFPDRDLAPDDDSFTAL